MKLLIFVILSIFATNTSAQLPEISLQFFGQNTSDRLTFKYNTFTAASFRSAAAPYFTPSKKTVIYIQGWLEPSTDLKSLDVINAYLSRRSEYNVALLDWSKYSVNVNLVNVINRIKGASLSAISILRICFNGGLNINTTHIVGFSFGSIIASEIGRTHINPQIARITALEPGKNSPTIIAANNLREIDRRAAKYVDTIHTDILGLGCGTCNGHTAFFANNGIRQPGCGSFNRTSTSQNISTPIGFVQYFNLGCNHRKAPVYWANSVRGTVNGPYVANRCTQTRTVFGIPFTTNGSNCNATMGLFSDITTTNRDNSRVVKYYVTIN